MKTPHFSILQLLWSLCLVLIAGQALGAGAGPLPRSSPEAQGISSSAILTFLTEAEQKVDALHSVMIVRHGHVVAEGWWAPYAAKTPHELFSLSKSFTSTAVGLAVGEGKLSIDDPVMKFFPDELPADPSANLKSMRLRDLLCMSAGHQLEIPTSREGMTTRAFLAHPVPFKPGTHFKYNTPATFMLSAIVQKVTGQTVLDYLKPRLFAPLGIEDPTWDTNVQGISLGGYGLSLRTEDIARFGQLYLQKGKWAGKQLVPATWVEMATARQTSNGSNPQSDWDQGYGFQFWRSLHGAYRGDGAFGQYCLVLPEQDAVIAITAGVKDMQAVLNLIWTDLLPAMQPKKVSPDTAAQQKLTAKLAGLVLPTVQGSAASSVAARISGKKFTFPANEQKLESLTVENAGSERPTLKWSLDGQEQTVTCGFHDWNKGRVRYGTTAQRAVAASGAWTAEDTFTAKLCFHETPFVLTLTLHFDGAQVAYGQDYNVSFGSRPALLVGTTE